jgi:hypothetical protein
MQRDQLEHVISAAATVVKEDDFVVIGSQAILGSYPDAPDPLLRSIEADIYPLESPEKAEIIDGALGDGSQFHRTYGYYAHGVGPETAKPPAGWEERLVAVRVPERIAGHGPSVALCLEVHDLVLAKCAAGRDRDWDFARDALEAGLVDGQVLLDRVESLPIEASRRSHVSAVLSGIISQVEVQGQSGKNSS